MDCRCNKLSEKSQEILFHSKILFEEFFDFKRFPIRIFSFKHVPVADQNEKENGNVLSKIIFEHNIKHNNLINRFLVGKQKTHDSGAIKLTYDSNGSNYFS